MQITKENSSYISERVNSMKSTYPSLRSKPDSYVFSALCVKANWYKNPANILEENRLNEMIVDGSRDGGVDILLADPNSEEDSDLVIGQAKYYKKISSEDVLNAVEKMAHFYKDMSEGRYEGVNSEVQRCFLSLYSDLSDNAKIRFVFYTSAPQNRINIKNIEKKFREHFSDSSKIELSFYFAKDLEEEIKESESMRPSVEVGKLGIDEAHNVLKYGKDAIVVNASAFSIKKLYAQYSLTLLAGNLRYHVTGKKEIDRAIEETIREEPETFWLKNNGITIVCDEFEPDGKEVRLKNFSIVNGGQTTYILHRSKYLNENQDLFLPCKIIKTTGETQDEKNAFNLEIAKATNSQKPIKQEDLRANAPEQVRFASVMRQKGVFYQTKRGEKVPKNYGVPYLNSSLVGIGKLCLASIFQIPGTSRSRPSSMYQSKYYDVVFNRDQNQIAGLCKELLYIDHYFRSDFLKKFDKENDGKAGASERLTFAHNARTICIAFVSLASRYYQRNISEEAMQIIFDSVKMDGAAESKLYDIFANLDGVKFFIPPEQFEAKDSCDQILDRLFNLVIERGTQFFLMANEQDATLNATNFLKKDKNYYKILKGCWTTLPKEIEGIFSTFMPRDGK